MSELRRKNQTLKQILSDNNVLLEAQHTSPSGRWIICLGTQTFHGMPAWIVICVRSTDWWFELYRYTVAESDELLFEDARASAYQEARAKYELTVERLESTRYTEVATDEDSGMEVVEPDGETHDWIN